jgi:hypothetical protein
MTIGTDNLFIEPLNDWRQLSRQFNWNWYTFTFIQIEFEHERITGGIEFLFILLGLGFRIRWNYDPSKLEDMIKEIPEEWKEKSDAR